jgi:hypothetical protein
MRSARSTAAAGWVGLVTDRLVVPSEIDAQRFERRESFSGGEIEARGLEFLFDGTMQQEGKCGDVS